MAKIIKEYYETQIDMRGPGAENAKPAVTGTVCVLRAGDNKPLTGKRLLKIFNEAVKDFPQADMKDVAFEKAGGEYTCIKIKAAPPPGYKKLPPVTVAARG